jgi:hypothetical protein
MSQGLLDAVVERGLSEQIAVLMYDVPLHRHTGARTDYKGSKVRSTETPPISTQG